MTAQLKKLIYFPLVVLSVLVGTQIPIGAESEPVPFYVETFSGEWCVITPPPTCAPPASPTPTSTSTPRPSPTATATATPRPTPTSTPEPRPTITRTLPFSKGVAYPLHCEDMWLVGADWTYNATMNPKQCDNVVGTSNMRDLPTWANTTGGTTTMPISPTVIAGSNEPDLCPDQGCSTPQEWLVVQHWIESYYPGVIQFSPVPSPNDRYHYWLPAMRTLYLNTYHTYPTWDYLNAHVYLVVQTGSGGVVHNLAQMVDHMEWYFDTAKEWGAQDGRLQEEIVISEFAVVTYRDGSGEPLYDEAVALLDRFWNYPEEETAAEQARWYAKYDGKTLGEMVAAVAWYTAHDDPVWGFPGGTTALYYGDGHELTPLGVWFFNLRMERG